MSLNRKTFRVSVIKKTVSYTKEVKEDIEIDLDFIKMYALFSQKIWALQSVCAIHLLLFLIQRMNRKDNVIFVNARTLDEFRQQSITEGITRRRRETNEQGYHQQTIKKALIELKEKQFLLSNCRNYYTINPGMFYSQSENDRETAIERLIAQQDSFKPGELIRALTNYRAVKPAIVDITPVALPNGNG